MRALLERFGRCTRAAWQRRGGWWLGGAVVAALVVAGCKSSSRSGCLDVSAPGDCDPSADDPGDPGSLPAGAQECALTAPPGSERGICVRYVDAGWHMTLARMAYLPKSQLRCPDSAPYPGLWGVEIPDDSAPPRNVIGCSVNPLSSCGSTAYACVPFEPDYPACIVQSGPHDCDDPYYSVPTAVEEDGLGGEVTLCCPDPTAQPE